MAALSSPSACRSAARPAPGTCAAWTSSRTCCPRGRLSPGWQPWPGSARWTPTASSRRSAGTARARSWCSPTGNGPAGSEDSGYTPMTPGDLRRVISALDVAPLGAAPERGFRPSLAGFQRKALLGRAADGTWQLPYGDAPSTWILKPDGPHPMAANEATCLRLAAACGLDGAGDRTARRRRASRAGRQALRQAGLTRRAAFRPGCTRRTAARRPPRLRG